MNLVERYIGFYNYAVAKRQWRMVIEIKGESSIRDFPSIVIRKLGEMQEDTNSFFRAVPDGGALNDDTLMSYAIRLFGQEVNDIGDITYSQEGQLLIAALGRLSNSVYRDLTPEQILAILNRVAKEFEPPAEPGGEDNVDQV